MIEGPMCHYVADDNRHLGGIVISRDGDSADIVVPTNAVKNARGEKAFSVPTYRNVRYSGNAEPNTWHWLEGCNR